MAIKEETLTDSNNMFMTAADPALPCPWTRYPWERADFVRLPDDALRFQLVCWAATCYVPSPLCIIQVYFQADAGFT